VFGSSLGICAARSVNGNALPITYNGTILDNARAHWWENCGPDDSLLRDLRARATGQDMAANWRNPSNPGNPTAYQEFLEREGFVSPSSLQGETAEMRVACDCGYDRVLIVPVPPPARLSCPGCGTTLNTAARAHE
jgi:hypothetical protein